MSLEIGDLGPGWSRLGGPRSWLVTAGGTSVLIGHGWEDLGPDWSRLGGPRS